MKISTSRKSGFTLVEIMIVVAIIGLLAAIAIPNFVKARTASQKNACIANLKQLEGAKATWALENNKVAFAAEWDVKVGVYQINPSYLDNDHGLTLGSPAGTVGALFPVELTWSPKLGPSRLPGTYRVGAWYDNATQADVFLAANGQPRVLNPGLPALQRNGEHGYYVNLQQQVSVVDGHTDRGISLFLNYIHADPDTTTISQTLSAGLLYAGPFAARPKDTLGFAAGWTKVNPRVADGQALQNSAGATPPVAVRNAEYPFELFYSVVATPWLTLGPALQYIYRPGGTSANPNVVVVGLNASIAF